MTSARSTKNFLSWRGPSERSWLKQFPISSSGNGSGTPWLTLFCAKTIPKRA